MVRRNIITPEAEVLERTVGFIQQAGLSVKSSKREEEEDIYIYLILFPTVKNSKLLSYNVYNIQSNLVPQM